MFGKNRKIEEILWITFINILENFEEILGKIVRKIIRIRKFLREFYYFVENYK